MLGLVLAHAAPIFIALVVWAWRSCQQGLRPLSVNYHFHRQCNYSCGFCFHTATTSDMLPIKEAQRGLRLLAEAGMKKINFSGGEPFLQKKWLGEMVRYAKEDLRLESVTIVSNGSLVTDKWFRAFGSYVDILAVSCDSFVSATNARIGRGSGKKGTDHVEQMRRVAALCKTHNVIFKLNTVVNTFNKDENMATEVLALQPSRWKVFQCLVIAGENAGPAALRNAEEFTISDDAFREFVARHAACAPVPESNDMMRNSYLILDEYMQFLDCTGGAKTPSRSILDVGVANGLNRAGFDEKKFFARGGKYNWSKKPASSRDIEDLVSCSGAK